MYLSKDELLLIANKLDLPSILNLSVCNKRLYNRMNMDDIWNNKLNEFPDFECLNIKKNINFFLILLYNVQNLKRQFNCEENIYEIYNSTDLNLNACNLTKIPKEILFLINLEHLFLSQNKIRDITPLTKLYNLKYLYLHHNFIRKIPKEISNMVNLCELGLSHNMIQHIPPELYNMKNLRNVDFLCNIIEERELYNFRKRRL